MANDRFAHDIGIQNIDNANSMPNFRRSCAVGNALKNSLLDALKRCTARHRGARCTFSDRNHVATPTQTHHAVTASTDQVKVATDHCEGDRLRKGHMCTLGSRRTQVNKARMRSEDPSVGAPEKFSARSTCSRCSTISRHARSASPARAAFRKAWCSSLEHAASMLD